MSGARRKALLRYGLFAVLAIVCACWGAASVEISAADRVSREAVLPIPAAPRPRGPVTILVLGDSLAYGYGASTKAKSFVSLLGRRLARARPGSIIINASYPGARTREVLGYLKRRPNTRVDAIIVVSGANDIRKLTPPLAFARDQSTLLVRLHREFPGTPILMSNVPDVSGRYFSLPVHTLHRVLFLAPFRLPLGYLIDIDAGIQEKIARRSGATMIDLHALSQKTHADNPRYISGDGLHPNDAGHARIAAFVWRPLSRVLEL